MNSDLAISKHIPYRTKIDLHVHTCFEVGFCLSGRGRFYFGNKTYEVFPGDVFVVNNLEHHIAWADPQNPSEFLFLFFEPSIVSVDNPKLLAPFLYRPDTFENKIPAEKQVSHRIGELLKTVYDEFQEQEQEFSTMTKGILIQVLVLLYRYFNTHSALNYFQYSVILQPAIAYMEKNFQNDIQFSEITSLLALSPSRVRQIFKQTYGFGFLEYINLLRVNESKRLLLTTSLTTLEIGLQSGFQSLPSFYRSFTRHVGMSPNEYRSKCS